jgi:polar amino acid transport system substrate-binding protein
MLGMRALRLLPLVIGLLSAGAANAAGAAAMRLAAEDWPPYVTPVMPENGVTGAMASAVLARLGSSLDVDYFPWKRTMEFGLHNPQYAGFMAVWRTPEREKLCYFSSPLGSSQSVLAYWKDAPVHAASLSDLRSMRVGVVGGHSNGEEFDALVRKGTLQVEEGVNDETNLRKLMSRRFNAIVIERRVLRYLLSGPQFRAGRERITFSTNLFRERTMHLCFKRTPEGLSRQRAFNDAARELDLNKVEREYWRRFGDDSIYGPPQ